MQVARNVRLAVDSGFCSFLRRTLPRSTGTSRPRATMWPRWPSSLHVPSPHEVRGCRYERDVTVLLGPLHLDLALFPGAGLLSVTWLLEIWSIMFGISSLLLALRLRGDAERWAPSKRPQARGVHHPTS